MVRVQRKQDILIHFYLKSRNPLNQIHLECKHVLPRSRRLKCRQARTWAAPSAREQELVCFDSGFSYKHFHATQTAAAHSWNKWHFITRSTALLLMRFRKQAPWIPSNEQQRGTYNLLQHIIPPFYPGYFLTLGCPWWALSMACFSIRHRGRGVTTEPNRSGFLFQLQKPSTVDLFRVSWNGYLKFSTCSELEFRRSREEVPGLLGAPKGPHSWSAVIAVQGTVECTR